MVMLLRRLAWLALATLRPSEDELDAALRAAFVEAGVPLESYAHDFDPGYKRMEVLHHAAVRLGNPLRTVGDLRRLLR